MKPMGPVPDGFATGADGTLAIGGRSALDWAASLGTPCFLYDRAGIAAKVARFRAAFPASIALHYAVKANPYGPLLGFLATLVDGFDLASIGEYERLVAAGGSGLPVSFAGPGKRDAELEAAIAAGVVLNLESEGEAARALAIADQLGIAPRVAVRVNPPFAMKGAGMKMGGLASPFGVDADRVPALVRQLVGAGADFHGLHVYGGSQLLRAEALVEAQAQTVALAAQIGEEARTAIPHLNLGGGFGIPYAAGDVALDVEAVGAGLAETLAAAPPALADTRFAIELGRWLVGEAGIYLSRVVDVKTSQGRRFAILDGGLHHLLAASGNFGQLLRRNFPVANASKYAETDCEEVTISGCLCTPLDLIADDVLLPRIDVGDVIAVFCQGAYGLSASPQAFLSQPEADEALV